MIDTHAHLDFPQYDKDRDKVIEEAFASGLKAIINIGVDLESSQKSIKLAEKYKNIYATVGFHPHDASKLSKEAFIELEKLASHPRVVAIGEIGLDFYRNLSPEDVQIKAFKEQIELAKKLNLPIVVHIRNAYEKALEILREKATGMQGVLHCFSGDENEAKEALEMGFYLSFNGTLTYRNSRSAEIVKKIPLSSILVETDCPYLTPEPLRGKRNEPKLVRLVTEKIVKLSSSHSFKETDEIFTQNAKKLFNLDLK
ncbi:MAG: TatD family hydrolase [candidate division Zixibacteria bacterium]|nr:TatD family hydrolase [candidate division Zixibacteria bacterium]